jgi:hypothetical protein
MCTITFEIYLNKLKFYHEYYNEIKNDEFFDDDYKDSVRILYIGYKVKVEKMFNEILTINAIAI